MAINGMVATPHYLASQTGLRVLREGGNAVDAAVAANAVLTVVMPDSCSIGGDAFFLLWDPSRRAVAALNGSGRSGSDLTIDELRSRNISEMPERGAVSVTVPGTVEAWQKMLEQYGTRELGTLLTDAIHYAREGFPVTPRLKRVIEANAWLLGCNAAATRQFLPSGEPPDVGTVLRQPALAMSLQQIARKGAEVMYSGMIGERIAKDISRLGGFLSVDDLAGHTSNWVEPIRTDYRGYEVLELPPNTQGITALQLLNIAEEWQPSEFPVNSAEQIHHFVEAKKHAFRDRDHYIGDPDFVDVPVDRLISKEYAEEIRKRIDPDRASIEHLDRPGPGDTIYMCVFDSEGLAVSLIQSIYRGFGSGIVAEGTGVLLQNRGASFRLN
jgi:gamma-glutamyltranspeptidase / glutathione hydrolase